VNSGETRRTESNSSATPGAAGSLERVFISHASQDAAVAARVCGALEEAGFPCWIAPRNVRLGEPYPAAIVNAINSCRMLVLILSRNAIESPHVLREVERASSKRRPILSVRIDASELPPELEYFLSMNQWLDASHAPLAKLVPELVEAVRAHHADVHAATGASTRRPPAIRRRLWAAAGVLALVAAVGLAFWLVRAPHAVSERSDGPSAVPVAAAQPQKPRIAVLPFDNLSPDPNNAFFTDGVHEEILATLANRAAGLEVISRTTMSTYKGKSVTVQALARELRCTYVLEGSIRREGDTVRLSLQLIDARTDSRVWGQDYDRKLVSAMALESEVATAVAAQLSLKFAGGEETASSEADPAAYDLYLKARAIETKASDDGSVEGLRAAEHLLGEAIEIDPKFVRAYLARMRLRASLFLWNYVQPDEVLPLAHADLATAQKLAPQSPLVTAYAAILSFVERDCAASLEQFDRAEAQGLADPEILDWKNRLIFEMGRYPEAAALSRRLADLDPRNESAQGRLFYMLMEMHEYREALRVADLGVARGRDPAGWAETRANVVFYAGGDLGPRRVIYQDRFDKPWRTAQDVEDHIEDAFVQLLLEHRFGDLRALIDSSPIDDWNCSYVDWPAYRIGRTPVADIRGWADLLMRDPAAAQRDGRRILDYLTHTPETQWNRWYRSMLRADAQLFLGDGAAANRTAREALALTRATTDVSDQMNALIWGTRIQAWTDTKQEAAVRLVDLASAVPGLWPAEITSDPIYSVPLQSLPVYQDLSRRLTAQMQASGLK